MYMVDLTLTSYPLGILNITQLCGIRIDVNKRFYSLGKLYLHQWLYSVYYTLLSKIV